MRTPWIVLVALVLAGCTAAPTPEDSALAYLEHNPGPLHLTARAAAEAGPDLAAWPQTDPLANRLDVPDDAAGRYHGLAALAVAGGPAEQRDAFVAAVWETHDGEQFGQPSAISDDMLAVEALALAGVADARIDAAAEAIRAAQASDGGWRYDGRSPGEPDETAWAVAALASAGRLDASVQDAVRGFLDARVLLDGGFDYGGNPNCQSTGMALRAGALVGWNTEPTRRAVLACQNADGGFPYQAGGPSNAWTTADVLIGLTAT